MKNGIILMNLKIILYFSLKLRSNFRCADLGTAIIHSKFAYFAPYAETNENVCEREARAKNFAL